MRTIVGSAARAAAGLIAFFWAVTCAAQGLTPPSLSFSIPSQTVPGAPYTAALTVSGPAGPGTGSGFDFIIRDLGTNGTAYACFPGPLDITGSTSCTFTGPPAGSYRFEITYFGDPIYNVGSTSGPFVSQQIVPSITQSGLPASTAPGLPLFVTAHVASSSPLGVPIGLVQFRLYSYATGGSSVLCATSSINGSGDIGCGFTAPGNGNYRVEVEYFGDTPNAPAMQSFDFSTAQVTPTITLSGLPATTVPGVPHFLTAHVSSPLGTPSGLVQMRQYSYSTGGSVVFCGTSSINGSGDMGCAFTAPGNGSYRVEVEYFGDASTAPGMQFFDFSSQQVTPTIGLSGLPAATVPGTPIFVTGHVSSASPLGTPIGLMQIRQYSYSTGGSVVLCGTSSINGSGDMGCGFTAPGNGSYRVEVEYFGDTPNAPRMQFFDFSSQQLAPTLALSGLPSTVLPGAALTLQAHVANSAGVATGNLEFQLYDTSTGGTSVLCGSSAVNSGGDIGCAFTAPSTLRTWRIYLVYSGDVADFPLTQGFDFVVGNSPLVYNTNDSGPGSLRDAILYVNGNCSGQTISFDIQPYGAVHAIQPTSGDLPALTCPGTVIDGYTQPGSRPNSLMVGSDAILTIRLDGSFVGGNYGLIQIETGPVYLRGLVIDNFQNSGGAVSYGVVNMAPLGTPDSYISGCYIGVDPSGTLAMPNYAGIGNFIGTAGFVIGGASPADRNVVSGNSTAAITLFSGASSQVVGNYIGLDASGTTIVPSTGTGIHSAAGAGNTLIAQNHLGGIQNSAIIVEGPNALIQGNFVGFAGNDVAPLANFGGIDLIGATAALVANNAIAASTTYPALQVRSGNAIVRANVIGTDLLGNVIAPNAAGGVYVDGSGRATIGGIAPGDGNLIVNNGQYGVRVDWNGSAEIAGNGIFDNAGQGIDLMNPNYVTAGNDACDADTLFGGNALQNFPILGTAVTDGVNTTITGTLNSTANTPFRVEFFFNQPAAAASYQAGRAAIGTTAVTTDGTCNAPFTVTLPVGLSPGDVITATATDVVAQKTSWFSAAVTTSGAVPAPPSLGVSTSRLSFAPQLAGASASPSQTVILTSNGGASVNFSSITVPAGFVMVTNCPASLAPGASCQVNVSFAPATLGTYTGSLTISSNALPDPHAVALDGLADAPPVFTLSVPGPTPAGQPAQVTLDIGNPSSNPTSYDDFSVSITYPAGFTNAVPDAVLPAVGCGGGAHTGGTSGGNTIGATNVGSVNPGTTCTVVAARIVAPSTPGTYTFTIPIGGFTIASPFAYSNPAPIVATLVVTAPTAPPLPVVTLVPNSLTFASRTVSTTSAPQTTTLGNAGAAALAIASITITGDYAYTSTCPVSLAPGATCDLDVTFTPLVAGARPGAIAIASNANGSPHNVSLSGTATAAAVPVIELSTSNLIFPPQQLGTDSAALLVTVRNAGNAMLSFGAIVVGGEYRMVALPVGAAGPACPMDLAPGASCDIAIVFHPAGVNLRQGAVSIVSNAGAAPTTLSLAGTGLSPQPPQLSMASSLAFGNQAVGTRSAGRALAIANTSANLAIVTELSASGDFAVSDTCTTILAGTSCSPLVTFQPSAVGPRTGTLTVRTLRDSAPYQVSLTGTGEENRQAVLELSLTRVGFGNAFIGSSNRVTTVLRNTGQVPATIESIIATGSYMVSHGCVTIAPGASCPVDIRFVPGSTGPHGGTVEIRSNAVGSPQTIDLSGVGCFLPSLSVVRRGLLLCGM